ncbi:hypothetical protein HY637_04025 [Candidatus Woesearchaeota archaeon]|nr:hypothetical protein [Candidatus Woesearchaeota archaeon]
MNKTLFLLMLIPFALLGCQFIPSSNSGTNSNDIDVYIGTEGVIAEFVKNAPPQTVFEEGKFPVVMKIRNAGAYDIKDGLIAIGLEKDYVPKITLQEGRESIKDEILPLNIRGKSLSDLKGEENVISLTATSGKLDPQSESKQSTITATFCYPYKTLASATVCIDPDIASIRPVKKVCRVGDITLNKGQGAPITVRKIEARMVPDGEKIQPQFLIYLENTGSGISVNPEGYSVPCRESDFEEERLWNIAYIKAYSSESKGENQLECTPSLQDFKISGDEKTGLIRFRDKKDFVRCTFKEGKNANLDAYTSPLRIEIEYGYVRTISTNFLIQKPLKY